MMTTSLPLGVAPLRLLFALCFLFTAHGKPDNSARSPDIPEQNPDSSSTAALSDWEASELKRNSRHVGYYSWPTYPSDRHRPSYGYHYHRHGDHYHGHGDHYHGHLAAAPFNSQPSFYPRLHHDDLCGYEKPFPCWGSKTCVTLSQACDGHYDCPNHMDEHPEICIAGKRPSTENIEEFLNAQKTWIISNLFNNADIFQVAEALKKSENIEQLRWKLNLRQTNLDNIKAAFQAASSDSNATLVELGMPAAAWQTVKYFFTTLTDTGFAIN